MLQYLFVFRFFFNWKWSRCLYVNAIRLSSKNDCCWFCFLLLRGLCAKTVSQSRMCAVVLLMLLLDEFLFVFLWGCAWEFLPDTPPSCLLLVKRVSDRQTWVHVRRSSCPCQKPVQQPGCHVTTDGGLVMKSPTKFHCGVTILSVFCRLPFCPVQ